MGNEPQVTKPHLVALVLLHLGGEADLETIAVEAHRRFPREFSWRFFPELPDKELVRTALKDARRERNGELVESNPSRESPGGVKRYALTPNGRRVAGEFRVLFPDTGPSGTARSVDVLRILTPMLRSPAFKDFQAGRSLDSIGRREFLAAFQLFQDASSIVISGRLARTSRALDLLSDTVLQDKLRRFIEEGRDVFGI
jgi:hypothetical protein